jgi:hypothetical protein
VAQHGHQWPGLVNTLMNHLLTSVSRKILLHGADYVVKYIYAVFFFPIMYLCVCEFVCMCLVTSGP